MKKQNIRVFSLVGIMSGLAFALYFFEIPFGFLFPAAPFLKFEFSDIPAILTGIAAGPTAGVMVQLLKNILHAMFLMKEPIYSGEIANFAASVALMLPIVILYRYDDKKFKWISGIIGTVLMTVVMMFVNYFITFNLFGLPQGFNYRMGLILSTFTPFNLLKGTIITIVYVILYPKLKPIILRWLQNYQPQEISEQKLMEKP
ncbi:MAG: ECF transporter S component [Erysipelothrix sp.]|jgi:riboflavin transporter FmnP|nr:ECF transporter S component [Erysipelothrix sp.]